MIKFPCKICQKSVNTNHNSIKCDICDFWVHIRCNNLDNLAYELLKCDGTPWYCISCIRDAVPFSVLTDEQFFMYHYSDNVNYETSNIKITPPKNLQSLFKNFNELSSEENSEDDFSINCKYYDIDSFRKAKFNSDKHLSVLHINIASLSKHKQDLETFLAMLNFEFSIIAITETKITKGSHPTFDINLHNYNTFHTPTESSSGGTLLYVSKTLNSKIRKNLQIYKSKELESTFIEIVNKKKKNILVGCIYRHPCMCIDNFNDDYLQPLLAKLSLQNKQVILAGDFNINLLNYESNTQTTNFLNDITSNLFVPHITVPTRITSHSQTLIDNIFSNFTEFTSFISGNLTTSISDHLPQFLLLPNVKDHSIPRSHNLHKRNMKLFNENNFLSEINNIDWDAEIELNKNDANLSINNFYSTISVILDKYAPLKKLSKNDLKQKVKPWITSALQTSIKKGTNYLKNSYDVKML